MNYLFVLALIMMYMQNHGIFFFNVYLTGSGHPPTPSFMLINRLGYRGVADCGKLLMESTSETLSSGSQSHAHSSTPC